MASWKETVTSVSDKVFPGLNHKIDVNSYGNEVMSDLPLQMTLYFNVVFTPVWVAVLMIFLDDKYHCYGELYRFIVAAVFLTILPVEILRLYLGYEGNLKDKIPELAGFWMLSVIIQFPLQSFLLFNPYFKLDVLEVTVQAVMFILLTVQLIFGYRALKFTGQQQSTYFRIMKLGGKVTLAEIKERYKVQ